MKKTLSALSPFLMTYLCYLVFGMILISTHEKNQLHLIINQYHSDFGDVFFRYYTNLGDGAMMVALLPLLFFKKVKNLLLAAFSGVFAGIIAQFLKRVCFPEVGRPGKIFDHHLLHIPEGLDLHNGSFSFPSGHSASVFALFLVLAYIFRKNKTLQIIFSILACLGAFSRVYLSQHFLGDTLAGSFVGIISFLLAIIVSNLFTKLPKKSLYEILLKKS